jgi:hypothetical protein
MEWRTIESAPHDGSPVLGWLPYIGGGGGCMAVIVKARGNDWVTAWDTDFVPRPSHWMPLPSPPVTESEAL